MTCATYDSHNPVIHYPPTPYQKQYQNFRDQLVSWHKQTQKWVITTLAELHELVIWTSDNLKVWTPMSEFGPVNAVGGVWECPGLLQLPVDGQKGSTKWVVTVALNPGGPPDIVGSGSQYFVGEFRHDFYSRCHHSVPGEQDCKLAGQGS